MMIIIIMKIIEKISVDRLLKFSFPSSIYLYFFFSSPLLSLLLPLLLSFSPFSTFLSIFFLSTFFLSLLPSPLLLSLPSLYSLLSVTILSSLIRKLRNRIKTKNAKFEKPFPFFMTLFNK